MGAIETSITKQNMTTTRMYRMPSLTSSTIGGIADISVHKCAPPVLPGAALPRAAAPGVTSTAGGRVNADRDGAGRRHGGTARDSGRSRGAKHTVRGGVGFRV